MVTETYILLCPLWLFLYYILIIVYIYLFYIYLFIIPRRNYILHILQLRICFVIRILVKLFSLVQCLQ